jgi:hypothetical protein
MPLISVGVFLTMFLAMSFQDVSRLVDVCRQTVVFKKVEGITACISLIAADPEVRVMRIKNRLDPAYDARRSAGYRDVAVNLQIVSAQTKELGIDNHVCELQLMLQEVAELKVYALLSIYAYLDSFSFSFVPDHTAEKCLLVCPTNCCFQLLIVMKLLVILLFRRATKAINATSPSETSGASDWNSIILHSKF